MSDQQKELILTAFRDTLVNKADDSIEWSSMKEVLKACDPEACSDEKLEILLQTAVSQKIADSAEPTAKVKLEPFVSWLLSSDRPTAGPSSGAKSLVLVGYGPIGHGFLKRLLEAGAGQFKVTVLCEEPYAAYNRVKLTTYFTHREAGKIAYSSEDWCNKMGVQLVFGKADKIDRAGKKVEVSYSNGGSGAVQYDELVLATGSKPFVPPAPAGLSDTTGIFVYRTIKDCQAIIDYAKGAKKAAVIGGGLLGLEAAKAVYDLSLSVDVIEFGPCLLGVQIDVEAGEVVKQKVEGLGVKVHTNCKTLEVLKDASGAVCGLKIDEGGNVSTLEVQMVIVSAGVRPRQELAEACGLELGTRGGVKVDGGMRSVTDEHVYAVGEIASLNGGPPYGLAAPGYAQAEVLADNLVNPSSGAKYTGSDLSTKLTLMGVDVASFGGNSDFWFTGLYKSDDGSKVKNLVAKDAASYKKLVFTPDGKKLLGGILVGAPAMDFPKLAAVSKKEDLGGLTPEDIMAGALPKVDDGGDGTNLGPNDNVCNCHSVQKWIIQRAIEEGADTFQGIRDKTRAGTGCGGCVAHGPMPKILAHTLRKLNQPRGVCAAMPFSQAEIEEVAKARQLKTFDAFAWSVCPLFENMAQAEQDEARAKVTPILDGLFSGKAKGDGMSHLEQLKALKTDLFAFIDKVNCNPIMVRLAWHDSGTYDKRIESWPECGGANASIMFKPEIDHGANNGLSKALSFLAPFKTDYPLVSWADLIQMASAVSIEHAGGPKIPMRYGRKDVSGPEACPAPKSRGTAGNAGLPDAEAPYACGADSAAQHLRNIFNRMGFDDKGIVALSGAHTLGRAFKERSGLVNEGYGEANACPITKAVGICPVRKDGKSGVGMPGGKSWTKKWLTFDNGYFKEYKDQNPDLIWFSTDRALHTDDGFKPFFQKYAEDEAAFFEDYKEAHKMLSELGSKFEPAEGIAID